MRKGQLHPKMLAAQFKPQSPAAPTPMAVPMSKIGPSKVPGPKAGPNGSFPIGDKKHDKLAIGGATRSFNAGNIGKSTENAIKAKARRKLGHAKDMGI